MKKLISLFAAAAMIFAGTTPANADVTNFDDWQWWPFPLSQSYSISYTGSLQEGGTYRVVVSGTTPNGESCQEAYLKNLDTTELASAFGIQGAFTLTSGPLTAGAAGTFEQFGSDLTCPSGPTHARYMRLNFESAIGTPSNFSVFPQAGGTAFTTWGIASGATGYTVTATPGGQTCSTTDNFCTISGLSNGQTYSFSVVGKNGNSSGSAASLENVLMRQPVNVAVALSGGTWKVGETVSAQVAVQGQGGVAVTWYRCDQVVGAMPAPPAGCTSVGSGTSTSYTLTSADVGKYITAHVFVNNTDPQGQMTASNNNVVLASNAVAPAPVADPGGKPTIVNIPERIVPVTGGTEIVITGTGLAGVTSVTIGGVPTDVVSKTDTSITVKVPVSGKTGAADVVITNAKGSVTEKGALVYTTAPVTKITKTKTVTGFTATQKTLTAAQKTAVKALITANPTLTQLTCEAKTTGVAVKAAELTKAKALATATCAYATTVKKTLLVGVSASQSQPKAKASRSVLLTLKN